MAPVRTATELPAERSGHAAPPELAERRNLMTAALAAGTWRIDAPHNETRLNGVRVLRFTAPGRSARGVVLHLHGGGFRLGCPEMVGPFAAVLAARCSVDVVCPDYRLAPEHPFPCGLRDAWAVMLALSQTGEGPVILSGDSAGGGLAAALAALSVEQRQKFAGLVLISPWLDLTVTSNSYDDNAAGDPLFSKAEALKAAALYLQGAAAQDPLASPLFGPVKQFPPTLISVGLEEVLLDDARRFHAKLLAGNADARLSAIAGMQHVAVTRNLSLPGAAKTFEAVATFMDGLALPPRACV
jgi:acetyl esterase/lipase